MSLFKDIIFFCTLIFCGTYMFNVIKTNAEEKEYLRSVLFACINERPIMLKAPEEKDTVIVLCKRV